MSGPMTEEPHLPDPVAVASPGLTLDDAKVVTVPPDLRALAGVLTEWRALSGQQRFEIWRRWPDLSAALEALDGAYHA